MFVGSYVLAEGGSICSSFNFEEIRFFCCKKFDQFRDLYEKIDLPDAG